MLSIIGVALVQAEGALSLSSVEIGLIGAMALIGIFFGGLIFGYITDKVGRQTMYTVDLLLLIVGSILCVFVQDAWQLMALRFALGVAIGADYPIATSLLAEFVPRRGRGFLLGALTLAWAAGALVAYLVGYAMLSLGDDAWRLMLATPAIPGIATVLLRLGTPESPRWLLSKGRTEEAHAVVREVYGEDARLEDLPQEEAVETDFAKVWRKPYLGRMVFAGLYWMLQVTPLYAVLTYGPSIFEELGFGTGNETYIVAAVIEVAFLIGTVPAMFASERMGRRPTQPVVLLADGGRAHARRRRSRLARGRADRLRRLRDLLGRPVHPAVDLPERAVPDRRAGHRVRHRDRVQPSRRRERHVPRADPDRQHRHRRDAVCRRGADAGRPAGHVGDGARDQGPHAQRGRGCRGHASAHEALRPLGWPRGG